MTFPSTGLLSILQQLHQESAQLGKGCMLLERELIILWLMSIFWYIPTCKLIIFGLEILKPTSTNKTIRAILFHSGFEVISCLLTVAASGNWELGSFVARHSEFALIDLPILKGNSSRTWI